MQHWSVRTAFVVAIFAQSEVELKQSDCSVFFP